MSSGALYNFHFQNGLHLYTIDQIQRPKLNSIKLNGYQKFKIEDLGIKIVLCSII